MRLNTLKPAEGARKERTRVGRGIGSGLGKTAGRGQKGQYARRATFKPSFEGGQTPMQRRLPKIGFRSLTAKDTAEVLLYKLELVEGDTIDFAALKAAKLVPSTAKRAKIVKKGELSRKLVIKGIALTAGAKAAVEAAGGSIEE